jgi:serine/threonine protein kinase
LRAPETLERGDTQITDKSNIWTLGVILYRLLYGFYPFQGSREEMLRKIAEGQKHHQTAAASGNTQQVLLPVLVSKEV